MRYVLNVLYVIALIMFSPVLIYRTVTTRKYRRGLWRKVTGCTRLPFAFVGDRRRTRIWFHAVSVGEVHLLRPILARLRQRHPEWDVIISTTTDTGHDEASKRYPEVPRIFWPLDFSWAVDRALREVRADLVVLAECEIWPNFLMAAERRGVPVAVINGRMSPRSFQRYRRLGSLAGRVLRRIRLFAMQTEEYANNLRLLGVPNAHVTGNIKYDGVETDRRNPKTVELRRLLQVNDGDIVWIAGSTQAPEESYCVEIFRKLRATFPRLRLFLVPRQKERFDEVGAILERSGLPYCRRSSVEGQVADRDAIVLVDTIGELGALWGLADVAFVGGSLDGQRGGQNMIEPAAYGAAVVFGPHTWNFKADVARLLAASAAIQVQDQDGLEQMIRRLAGNSGARDKLGSSAQKLVQQHRGAADRTMALLENMLPHKTAVAA